MLKLGAVNLVGSDEYILVLDPESLSNISIGRQKPFTRIRYQYNCCGFIYSGVGLVAHLPEKRVFGYGVKSASVNKGQIPSFKDGPGVDTIPCDARLVINQGGP